MSGPLRTVIYATSSPSVANFWLCKDVEIPSFTDSYPTLNPTQLIIMPSKPNHHPPSLPRIQPCTQTPQEAAAQMNSLLCSQNTWHPPTLKRESIDLWSILSQPHRAHPHRPHKQTCSTHIKSFKTPHTHMEKSTLSTPRLRYPSVPVTPTHPNPHQTPNSELVWPLRIPPARPRHAPLAETMATSRWVEKMDGQAGLETKQHVFLIAYAFVPSSVTFYHLNHLSNSPTQLWSLRLLPTSA